MKRLRVIISGDVQGVGFRSWLRAQGLLRNPQDKRVLSLVGWVKNRDDGAVEAVFEGKKEKLDNILALCRQGPETSRVEDVQVEWSEAKGEFDGFEIRF